MTQPRACFWYVQVSKTVFLFFWICYMLISESGKLFASSDSSNQFKIMFLNCWILNVDSNHIHQTIRNQTAWKWNTIYIKRFQLIITKIIFYVIVFSCHRLCHHPLHISQTELRTERATTQDPIEERLHQVDLPRRKGSGFATVEQRWLDRGSRDLNLFLFVDADTCKCENRGVANALSS